MTPHNRQSRTINIPLIDVILSLFMHNLSRPFIYTLLALAASCCDTFADAEQGVDFAHDIVPILMAN